MKTIKSFSIGLLLTFLFLGCEANKIEPQDDLKVVVERVYAPETKDGSCNNKVAHRKETVYDNTGRITSQSCYTETTDCTREIQICAMSIDCANYGDFSYRCDK